MWWVFIILPYFHHENEETSYNIEKKMILQGKRNEFNIFFKDEHYSNLSSRVGFLLNLGLKNVKCLKNK